MKKNMWSFIWISKKKNVPIQSQSKNSFWWRNIDDYLTLTRNIQVLVMSFTTYLELSSQVYFSLPFPNAFLISFLLLTKLPLHHSCCWTAAVVSGHVCCRSCWWCCCLPPSIIMFLAKPDHCIVKYFYIYIRVHLYYV